MSRLPIARPSLSENARRYVIDCIDSNWISSHGRYIGEFEAAFARYCGVKHAIATCNGTVALHLALVAMGVGPGDEILVPTVTYIATANAVRYCGATPILVDVCPDTLNIDARVAELKISARTRGIIPVHLYGHPAEMDDIGDLADRHGLFVLEDAAEAHGAEYRGRKTGSFGRCASFSFFGNKIITTGEGGMVTTDDDEVAAALRLYRGQGMDLNRRYWFPVVGYNYRMTNIQAAIGLAQLEVIDTALMERRRLAEWYSNSLSDLTDLLVLPTERQPARHVYWMYTIYLRQGDGTRRDAVMHYLEQLGIETRPVFHPMHVLPPYREDGPYPVADLWAQRGINLPTHGFVTQLDVERVTDALKEALAAT